MNDLLTAVRAGAHREVPALVLGLDRAGRRAALAGLKELRKEARGWEWQRQDKIRKALQVAGAGCHTGAAGCAGWIGGRDLRGWSRSPYPLILAALGDRDPAWLGDLARRLAAKSLDSEADFTFISELARMAGCPVPATDSLVEGWAERISTARWHARSGRVPLTGVLRSDPHVTVLAPRLFEMAELPAQVGWYESADSADHWPAALSTLAAEGVLDRSQLVERCVTRLVRGGKPGDQRFFLTLLQQLGLTEDEEGSRLHDWTVLAADGISVVASHAQDVLGRLDARGELSVRELAEVSGSVLFRPEKKLVRAQLMLLGKALGRDTTTAGELLPVVAEAFGNEDIALQERALKLIARHLPAAGEALREELSLAAAQLGPLHRDTVTALFGAVGGEAPAEGPYEELLPPAPVLSRLDPAPRTVAELVEEVAAQLKSRSWQPATPGASAAASGISGFERALDGLVRLARTDRAELTEALQEALAGVWSVEDGIERQPEPAYMTTAYALALVVGSFLGRISGEAVAEGKRRWTGTGTCAHAALNGVLLARAWEAAGDVRTDRVPFLLATPTWHTGSLDPAELVGRLRTYRRFGAPPGPADFAQALLRVCRSGEEGVAEAAADLGTPEGDRLAAWIRAGEPVASVLRHGLTSDRPSAGNWWRRSASGARKVLLATRERPLIQEEFPRSFHWLGRPHVPDSRDCYHWGAEQCPHWAATLPEDGETLAAWLMPDLLRTADEGPRGGAWVLPSLVETGGGAGVAMHLALAYGLGARHPEDRISAVDALLVLAARDRLDTALLGRELAVLVDHELLKVVRLADSARTAAATGAYRTVLGVLAAALPTLLAYEKAPRGLGDLLAVAAECAERCGTEEIEPIAGLAATAGRKGTSQTVRQAARLLAAFPTASPSVPEVAHEQQNTTENRR
ncbi:hypothetical protein B7C62_03005 [Kitasatospora albolonga]|uniref:Secreted protein n=1 Tax=Kitasatospora albolonga TaxID=68173 RepID=A0ABC8BN72_9ACTN|nr:hypothetical protein B7C62_03005 [Kitasatospora albolonga]